jgi:hypothetical protein
MGSVTAAAPPGADSSVATWAAPAFAVAMVAAAGLAIRASLAVAVVGLIVFGILHNVLELRYVVGRFAPVLAGTGVSLLIGLISLIVAARAAAGGLGRWSIVIEILAAYGVLAWAAGGVAARGAACHRPGLRRVGRRGVDGLPGLLRRAHHPSAQHRPARPPLGLVAATGPRRPRTAFRAVNLCWVVVVPAVILLGLLDPWLATGGDVVATLTDGASLTTATTPPDLADSTVVATRLLTVFAFMQTMHYVVWVGFLPWVGRSANRAVESRWPWAGSRRVWGVGVLVAVLLAMVFLHDYSQGRGSYATLATYHVYLEIPVVLALLAGAAPRGSTP